MKKTRVTSSHSSRRWFSVSILLTRFRWRQQWPAATIAATAADAGSLSSFFSRDPDDPFYLAESRMSATENLLGCREKAWGVTLEGSLDGADVTMGWCCTLAVDWCCFWEQRATVDLDGWPRAASLTVDDRNGAGTDSKIIQMTFVLRDRML